MIAEVNPPDDMDTLPAPFPAVWYDASDDWPPPTSPFEHAKWQRAAFVRAIRDQAAVVRGRAPVPPRSQWIRPAFLSPKIVTRKPMRREPLKREPKYLPRRGK